MVWIAYNYDKKGCCAWNKHLYILIETDKYEYSSAITHEMGMEILYETIKEQKCCFGNNYQYQVSPTGRSAEEAWGFVEKYFGAKPYHSLTNFFIYFQHKSETKKDCECGAKVVGTTHSDWCPAYDMV